MKMLSLKIHDLNNNNNNKKIIIILSLQNCNPIKMISTILLNLCGTDWKLHLHYSHIEGHAWNKDNSTSVTLFLVPKTIMVWD